MTSAFARLLRLEIGFLLRLPSFWWLFAPLTAALLVAAHLGGERLDAQHQAAAAALAEEQRIEAIAAETTRRLSRPSAPRIDFYRDPSGAYSYMTMFLVRHAIKAPTPLTPLAIGQSDVLPSDLRMTFGFSAIFTDDFVNISSPRALKLGGFDIAFVLIYLLPLALIGVAAPRMSFEQDSGILRMIAAQPVALGTVAAAKFGALAILYLAWLVLAGGSALWVGGMLPVAAAWGSILAWLALGIAFYGLFWIGIGALAAGLWRGGRAAVGFAFAAWALVTVLLPAAVALAIESQAPPVSRVAYIDASREAVDRFYAEGPQIAREWLSTHPQLAARPDLATTAEVARLARDHYFREVLAPFRALFDERQAAIVRMTRGMGMVSPAIVLRQALESAAGNDTARHGQFLADADRFGLEVRDFFEPRIVRPLLSPVARCEGCTAQLNFDGFSQVPRFHSSADAERPQPLVATAALFLMCFALVLLTLVIMAYRRKTSP